MNLEEYDRKINEMLSDEKTYQLLKRDPAPSLERQLNSLLLELKKKGSLLPELYEWLRSLGGLTPCLYGLPKIHNLVSPEADCILCQLILSSALKAPSQDSLPVDR